MIAICGVSNIDLGAPVASVEPDGRSRRGLMAMANLRGDAQRTAPAPRSIQFTPDAVSLRPLERRLRADDDLPLGRPEREHVQRRRRSANAKAEPLALADGEAVDAAVAAQHASVLVDDDAFARRVGRAAWSRTRA